MPWRRQGPWPSRARSQQARQAHQVVSHSRKAERQADPLPTSEAGSAQACNLLTPAKDLLDPLADALAQNITLMPGHAAINGRAAPGGVLRHVRGHVHRPKLVDEVLCI